MITKDKIILAVKLVGVVASVIAIVKDYEDENQSLKRSDVKTVQDLMNNFK